MGTDGIDKMGQLNKRIKLFEAFRQGKLDPSFKLGESEIKAMEELGVNNSLDQNLSRHEKQKCRRSDFMADKEQQLNSHIDQMINKENSFSQEQSNNSQIKNMSLPSNIPSANLCDNEQENESDDGNEM